MLISLKFCLRKVVYQHIIYFHHVFLSSMIGFNHNLPVSRRSYRKGQSLLIWVIYIIYDQLFVWLNFDLDGSFLLINEQYVSNL